jgi:hypothetical protein
MARRIVAGCGALLSLAGLVLLVRGGAPALMDLFGSSTLPPAQAGDPAWVGVGFIRVSGAAIAALGLIIVAASRLKGEAARAIGGAAAAGLGLLGIVTLIQAQAIWSTLSGWLLAAVVLLACMSGVILSVSARQATAQ